MTTIEKKIEEIKKIKEGEKRIDNEPFSYSNNSLSIRNHDKIELLKKEIKAIYKRKNRKLEKIKKETEELKNEMFEIQKEIYKSLGSMAEYEIIGE